jgi:hypothetical protein
VLQSQNLLRLVRCPKYSISTDLSTADSAEQVPQDQRSAAMDVDMDGSAQAS